MKNEIYAVDYQNYRGSICQTTEAQYEHRKYEKSLNAINILVLNYFS